MLIALLSAFLKDVVTVARVEAFFALPRAKREAEVKRVLGAEYPEAIKEYLATVSDDSFATDVQALLPVITSSHGVPGHLLESTKQGSLEGYRLDLPAPQAPTSKKTVDPAAVTLSQEFLSDVRAILQEIVRDAQTERRLNGFVQALAAAFSAEVAMAFDQGHAWKSTEPSQASIMLERIVRTDNAVEVAREIQQFLQEQCSIASPTIQSPVPLSSSEREAMRASLRERYPGSFPLFEVEPSLAGGLRMFYKGALIDESWITHIAQAFVHLRAAH